VDHERPVVGDVVIGGQDGDRHVAGQMLDAHHGIDDTGHGALVVRLHDEATGRELRFERAEVLAVPVRDDGDLTIRPDQQVGAPPRTIEHRLAVEQRAELLGSRIAGDLLRQRAQAEAVAAGEDDGPRVWSMGIHGSQEGSNKYARPPSK